MTNPYIRDPRLAMTPYAPLEADPANPERVDLNIASTVWDPPVSRSLAADVAAHVRRGQDAAAANVTALPELADVWGHAFERLRGVREANEFKELLTATDAEWRDMHVALARAATEQLAAGVDKVIAAERAKLARLAVTVAAQSLDPPERAVTDADTRWWNDLLPSLNVLTASAALPILRRALVTDAIRSGKYGRHELALPWLRSAYDEQPRWHKPEIRLLLTDAEATRFDAAAHTRRRVDVTVRRTEYQLALLGDEFKRTRGNITRSPHWRAKHALTDLSDPNARRWEPGPSFFGAFAGVDDETDPADVRVATDWQAKVARWHAGAA